jgi:SAM-dependent methyltransferase
MPNISDVQSALQHHYQNASRLDARIQLHAKYSTNKQGFHAWVFTHLCLPPTCRVLEVGCGSGRLWLENRHRLPEGWDLTLSDLSPGMLREAHEHLRAGRPLQFVVGDAQVLPFADGCFEAVIANHMLYHVPHRSAAYSEFRRVLKPGGRLYAATISRYNMRELDELVNMFRRSGPPGHETGSLISDRRLSTGFNLENGASELAQWFSSVILHRYDDALVVPEAEPLVEYVRSTGSLQEDALARLQHHVEAVIAQNGPIRISKEGGLFEAFQSGDEPARTGLLLAR